MPDPAGTLLESLQRSRRGTVPFTHWALERILPRDTCAAIDVLPVAPRIHGDTHGKRESNNSLRVFFNTPARALHPVCDAVARAFRHAAVIQRLEAMCAISLADSFLRIEYCLDTDGFWLEPHTDIGAKRFTLLVYLSDTPGSEDWGTDLLDASGTVIATTPYRRGDGFMFVPSADSWHGFRKRRIDGVRRSLIVNYVVPDWRARHELAFSDPVA